MSIQTRYTIYVLGSGLSAAISLVLTEIVISHLNFEPILVAVLGNVIGGFMLLSASAPSLLQDGQNWRRSAFIRISVAAFFTYALTYALIFYAISLIGAGKVALLGQLESVFVVLLATLFLGEQLSPRRWFAGVLALSGALVINFNPKAWQLTYGLGEILATLAPLGFAAGIITLKPVLDKVNARLVTGLVLVLGALFLTPFLPLTVSSFELNTATLVAIGLVGLMRAMAWLFYNMSLPHLGASRCAIVFLSFAFFTVLLQFVVAQLLPNFDLMVPDNLLVALFGGSLVTGGIIIIETEKS